MRHIYQDAKTVLIWLGEATSMEEGTLNIMPAITRIFKKAHADKHKLDPEEPDTFKSIGLPEPSHGIWQAAGERMNRPWFRRLWTLQEAVLPGTIRRTGGKLRVMCGTISLDWETLQEFADSMRLLTLDRWIITGHMGITENMLCGYEAIQMIESAKRPTRDAAGAYPLGTDNRHS